MGLIWRLGFVNCHINNKNNLEKFLVAVSLIKLDVCAVVESWFRGGEGEGRRGSEAQIGVGGERQKGEEGEGWVLGKKGVQSESSEGK